MGELIKTLAVVTAAVMMGAAQGTLVDRGGGLIYDDVLNVTWLQDANYAKTSGYDVDGAMNWADANAWAANLSYYDSARDVTYSDWRLPTLAPAHDATFYYSFANNGFTDIGYNINSPKSELSYMYYTNLENLSWCIPTNGSYSSLCIARASGYGLTDGPSLNDESLFSNIQGSWYWFDREYALNQDWAWAFLMNRGAQSDLTKTFDQFAWAVRDGDVAPVPEPSTLALICAALIGLTTTRSRLLRMYPSNSRNMILRRS